MLVDVPVAMSTVANPPPRDGVVQDGQTEIIELLLHSNLKYRFKIVRKPGVGNFLMGEGLCHELSLHLDRKVARCPRG